MPIGLLLVLIYFFEEKKNAFGTGFGWALMGLYLPTVLKLFVDLVDNTSWKSDLRKLIRGRELKRNDRIRISFAYLFRIKIDNKYLLVRNDRGTKKYQPVGGAYQFNDDERSYLFNKFKVTEDNKIVRDVHSHNDYRLFVPVKYMHKFMDRFNKTKNRENITDLSREFTEELIKTQILDFATIKYRYCGRHFTKIMYSRHFQCYELLLADIIEINLDESQREKMRSLLVSKNNKLFKFATDKEIITCGINEGTENLAEIISDHSFKILQECELDLMHIKGSGKEYEVHLD